MTSDHGQAVRPPAGRRGGGFSLIEIMLGVLILGLGLLGLAAVMPAVVAQQRNAADTMLGVAAAESASTYLARRPDLNRIGTIDNHRGLGAWFWDTGWSDQFRWAPPDEVDLGSGQFRINDDTPDGVLIPVSERLWPSPGSGRGAPVFVWDLLARRVPAPTADQPDPLYEMRSAEIEIVIFVRRVDAGIRPPEGETRWSAITGPDPPRVAIAEEPGSATPTRNGIGNYSTPKRLDVSFDPFVRDRLRLESASAGINATGNASEGVLKNLASKSGQTLVDNLGNAYTVVGVDQDDEDTVIIEPPIPEWAEPEGDGNARNELTQVAFTTQPPAAVEVIRLRAENPKEAP